MPDAGADLTRIRTGAVVAPAGCGKTHLIAEALRHHEAPKPTLVLTHTNAGVAALRGRLDRAGVAPARYRLVTLDGWALRLLGTFPARSGASPVLLRVENPGSHYPELRRRAVALLDGGHLDGPLVATYDRLIVDEYQDCGEGQHSLVRSLSRVLDTVILGDPMQAIFTFAGPTPDWEGEVLARFPLRAELDIPWRWRNAGTERLGLWLLGARRTLHAGGSVDLRQAPPEVSWVHLNGTNDQAKQTAAGKTAPSDPDGSVLLMLPSRDKNGQQRFARQIPGAVTVEAVDLRDLTDFASTLDFADPGALAAIMAFAEKVMSGVGASDLLRRIGTLRAGRVRKEATPAETAALAFSNDPGPRSAAGLLEAIGQQAGARPYRPEVLRACFRALQACVADPSQTFQQAAVDAREQGRLTGRPLPARAVGSTLLLKGLEADTAVILHADDGWDALDAKHLYVAMTRGARRLIVCSREPVLPG